MKKFLFFLLFLCASVGANAQNVHYRVTGDRVIARTGPGKQYKQATYSNQAFDGRPAYLYKEDVMEGAGEVRNGYMKVVYCDCNGGEENTSFDDDYAWVSVQYLKKMAPCPNCKGKGFFDRTCPDCKGEAYTACSCHGAGKAVCRKCWGIGAI